MGKNIQTTGDHLFIKLVIICLVVVVMNTHQQVHAQNNKVSLTYVKDAVNRGAVCNDGSPAAYYYDPGFGEGVNSWVIYLEGGGWCNTDNGCISRLTEKSGSTKYDLPLVSFNQIKSSNKTQNPDFYNWNRVYVMYCDSSSFMGTIDHPNVIAGRGAVIFDSLMDDLLEKGLANATNAIFSGGSAGGLAAILHCDDFRALLPTTSRVKCVIDSGFFIHAPKLHGAERRAEFFASVAAYHGFTNKLFPSCTSRMNASLCIFPEYIVKDIQTPLFLVESKFDLYQLMFDYVSDEPSFPSCLGDLTLCTPSHRQSLMDYGLAVTELLQEIGESSSIGMFVHPCLRHGHFYEKAGWYGSYKLKNKTIAEAVGDWFYDRFPSPFQEIDIEHDFPLVGNCTSCKIPNM